MEAVLDFNILVLGSNILPLFYDDNYVITLLDKLSAHNKCKYFSPCTLAYINIKWNKNLKTQHKCNNHKYF